MFNLGAGAIRLKVKNQTQYTVVINYIICRLSVTKNIWKRMYAVVLAKIITNGNRIQQRVF